MGQNVVAVVYGCRVPESIALYDADSDEGGVLDQYADSAGRIDVDESCVVFGAWLAPIRFADEFAPLDLSVSSLARLAESEEGKRAIRAWGAFAAWAKEQGHDFGAPTFWLAIHEVA